MKECLDLINNKIEIVNNKIEKDLKKSIDERGYMSQNIVKDLRDLVEHIAFKNYVIEEYKTYLDYNQKSIQASISYIKKYTKHDVLRKFHSLIQVGPSHNTYNEDGSTRLMVKYTEYLIELKDYYYNIYSEEILSNIYDFPIYNVDPALVSYYDEVYENIKTIEFDNNLSVRGNIYYITKTKLVLFKEMKFYELTLTPASDYINKSNHIVFYSKDKIPDNYAIKISYLKKVLKFFDSFVEVYFINNYKTFIRPCEFNNLYKIFGINRKVSWKANEFDALMLYLTKSKSSLNDIVNMNDNDFRKIEALLSGFSTNYIIELLRKIRNFIKLNKPGNNVIKYLIFRLRNSVLKRQISTISCSDLSDLYLQWGCKPFDTMPYATSLIQHNISQSDLIEIIDPEGREDERFSHEVNNICIISNRIYIPIKEFCYSKEEIINLCNSFNSKLIEKHYNRKLEILGDNVYVLGNENSTIDIISILQQSISIGYYPYPLLYSKFKDYDDYEFTDKAKESICSNLFLNSKIGLIYGSAGTGKTEMIMIVSKIFTGKKIAFLAKTHSAVNNIRTRIESYDNNNNYKFSTVDSFKDSTEYDLIVIDECSMLENYKMIKFLEKAKFNCLLLVGDIYQIESIEFGNWFRFAKDFLPKTSYELTENFRTNNHGLMELWSRVRNLERGITESIIDHQYSEPNLEKVFIDRREDEIVLCLNYDGPYGINNINRYLQHKNTGNSIEWGANTYKVGDPVIFSNVERFNDVLYNSLKGKIVDIQIDGNCIKFQILVDTLVNSFIAELYDINVINNVGEKSLIEFKVYKKEDDDKDDDVNYVVPFVVSYATSIHKAQGLEFSSVRIVICNESEEYITKNIFYTAITRAKEKLKIFWSPECQNKIEKNMKDSDLQYDIGIIKNRFKSKN
jgi:hypothetical protein